MDPLLVPIALSLAGSVTLFALFAHARATATRGTVRRRIVGQVSGAQATDTHSLLRPPAASRLPLVEWLPLSIEARQRMQIELERAGWALRVSEFVALRTATAFAGLLVAFIPVRLSSAPLLVAALAAAAGAGAGWLLPRALLARARKRRRLIIESQLAEALTAVAKSLRAGTGLTQALAYAASETGAPLGSELQAALRDLQLGAEPAVAFEALADRVQLPDLDIAVTAILIQRQVGGNLSEILTNVTNTIRERINIQREVRVLTARQRLTANLVAALPVLVAIAFVGINPDMGLLLVNNAAGRVALAVGLFFELVGILLVRRLAEIEV